MSIEAMKQALELLAVATFHSPELQAKRTEVIERGLQAIATEESSATQEPVIGRKEFEQWCKDTGHDYCFDLNEYGEYQWADAYGAYEAFCYTHPQPKAEQVKWSDYESDGRII